MLSFSHLAQKLVKYVHSHLFLGAITCAQSNNITIVFYTTLIAAALFCNEKYDIQGESSIAQDRKTMLPNLFTKETFCAGSNVRFLTIISRSAKS